MSYQPQIHMETLKNFGLHTEIIVWASYGDFYFSNLDLPYFNKYHMDFNPLRSLKHWLPITGTEGV